MGQRFPHAGRRFPHAFILGGTVKPARAAWCYGDPSASFALFTAARAGREPAWEAEAEELAREAIRCLMDDSGVKDAPLCDGASGLLHIYNCLHQAREEVVFASTARWWLEHPFGNRTGHWRGAFWSQDDQGAPSWVGRPCLLAGTTGTVFDLRSAASAVEPSWEGAADVPTRRGVWHNPSQHGTGVPPWEPERPPLKPVRPAFALASLTTQTHALYIPLRGELWRMNQDCTRQSHLISLSLQLERPSGLATINWRGGGVSLMLQISRNWRIKMSVYNFHTYMDAKNEWRWQLVAPNGRIVADSGEGYSSLDAVREAAQRVKNNAGTATID